MRCQICGKELQSPGDYCLACDTANCSAVYVSMGETNAEISVLSDEGVISTEKISMKGDSKKYESRLDRNLIGQVTDVVRRKKPDKVYVNQSEWVRNIRSSLSEFDVSVFKSNGSEVDTEDVIEHINAEGLERINKEPEKKVGGSHTTVIGGRNGQNTIHEIASVPYVKKVIPGPIDGGGSSGNGFRVDSKRVENNGNLRVLIKNGGTIQTVRVVTTASSKSQGEIVKHQLDSVLF